MICFGYPKLTFNISMAMGVAMTCMICTQSCYEGPGDMLHWINNLNKKVFAGSD